jgi:hypothetical protein
MRRRLAVTLFLTTACWFALSLLTFRGRMDVLWDHLGQALHFDEEFLAFSCYLLFSFALAVHAVAITWRASYRHRFLPPQLGLLYAVFALVGGSMIRAPLRDPLETWFIVVFTLLAVGGFIGIFRQRYARILRHGDDT